MSAEATATSTTTAAGGEGGEQTATANDQTQTQQPEAPKPGPPASQQQGDKGDDQTKSEPWNDPAAARAEIERLRRENGDSRINAKNTAREEGKNEATQDIARSLLSALGVEVPGEEQATPEQLTQQVSTVTSERDAAQLDAATVRAAWELGVDPAKLDYLAFKLGKSGALDTSAPDFSDKLKTSITALMAEDATLKRSGTVGASGAEHLAGSGGSGEITQEQFDKMPLDERTKLFHNDRATYNRLTGRS